MKYDLQDIATVSGMPGLYKVLKPTRTGVVLESLDDEKKRLMAQTRHKISILKEISIFTTGTDNSVPLETVFATILEKHNTKLDLNPKKMSGNELTSFIEEIVPDFDTERVYTSDVKKLISWFKIIAKELKPLKEDKKDDKKAAAPKKKAAAKKAPAKPKKTIAKPKAAMKKIAVTKKNG